jgi:predicted transcriptional regulator
MAEAFSLDIPEAIDARHVRMARAGLGLSVRDLAQLANVNKATIVRLEAGMPVRYATLEAVKGALEDAGATFYVGEKHTIGVSILAPK